MCSASLVPYPGTREQDVEDFSADRPETASVLGSGRAEPLANFFGSGLAGLAIPCQGCSLVRLG